MSRGAFVVGAIAACLSLVGGFTTVAHGDDSDEVLSIDHYVPHISTVPAINGQWVHLYVRERAQAGITLRSPSMSGHVVLFVHGAGTPAEVSFDVPFEDYSWMAFLAHAGYDVFAMDTTGYGRSSRPGPMEDPCNLSSEQQSQFVPNVLSGACAPSYPRQMTTLSSDWDDIDSVVDYVRGLRHVDQVDLVAWSLGGPRTAGYASQHPEKVSKLVVLAPAYNPTAPSNPPAQVPAAGVPMNTQSHTEFIANWDRQVGCSDQYDPAAADSIWSEMLQSDPVGASWDPGVRRAPSVTSWGWNFETASKLRVPMLMVSGQHDKQVNPDSVRQLWHDLGSTQKVFVDLGCSSHNAMWERRHLLLFQASLDWLNDTSVNGVENGMLRMGY